MCLIFNNAWKNWYVIFFNGTVSIGDWLSLDVNSINAANYWKNIPDSLVIRKNATTKIFSEFSDYSSRDSTRVFP